MLKTGEKKFLIIIILVYLAIVLPLAYLLNIWTDEASTLHTTQNGIIQIFQNVFADEKQAPFYFFLIGLWRTINDSIFFARLLSIIFGVLAIKVFYELARNLFDEAQSKFVTIIFALHPFLIWTSLEIRGYSLVILLSAWLLKFFEQGYLNFREIDENKQKRARIYFLLVSVVTLDTNYYSGFLLAGCFAALLVLRRWREAKFYFLQMIIVGVLTLPLLWIIKAQLAVRENGFIADASVYEGLKTLWNHSLNFIFPTELSPQTVPTIVSVIRIWLVRLGILGCVFILIKSRFRFLNEKILAFGTISLVVLAFLLFAYFVLGAEHIALRHNAPLLVPLLLFIALFLIQILPRQSWIAFALILAFLFPYSVYRQYPQLAKRGDWIRVAKYIEQNEKPNQPIIIFLNYDALNLPYYYQGVNQILPNKGFFTWNAEGSFSSENGLQRQTQYIISQIPPEAPEIWLATEEICQTEETMPACSPLENFVEANYTVLEARDFYKERVRLLRKK